MKNWWKILIIVTACYVFPMAFLGTVSVQTQLQETIRNLYFHVTMWFSMFILYIVSLVYSIRFLMKQRPLDDIRAEMAARSGLVFGTVGIFTGMVWANNTWGTPWTNDPQLNGAAITMLSYTAYFILRSSVADESRKARIAAVYNIFSFFLMFVLIGILPRINTSLHPGKGGNPGFGSYDLAPGMRPIFYGSILVWTLVGVWMMQISTRIKRMEDKLKNN